MGLLTFLVGKLGGEEMERRAAERAAVESDDEDGDDEGGDDEDGDDDRAADERAVAERRERGPGDRPERRPTDDDREDRRTATDGRP